MPTATIICLANSWKHGGRCIAGVRMDTGEWIRPVSPEPEGILQAWHYTLTDGGEAAVLDVLTIPLSCSQPEPHHPENWLIDSGQWERGASPALPELREILNQNLSPGPELLENRDGKIAFASLQQKPIAGSLALVRPEVMSCLIEGSLPPGRRRVRIVFTLAGTVYDLPLTDPLWLKQLEHFPDGRHLWEENGAEALLTISLSEPFSKDGFCYKLVAAVITLPTASAHKGLLEGVKTKWRIIWDWTLGRAGRRRF